MKQILSLDDNGVVICITNVPSGFENRLDAVIVPAPGKQAVVDEATGVTLGMQEKSDGSWHMSKRAAAKEEADQASAQRRKRDSLLGYADKMVNKAVDNGDTALETAWRRYRKQLREVPQQPAFPVAVDWPTQP